MLHVVYSIVDDKRCFVLGNDKSRKKKLGKLYSKVHERCTRTVEHEYLFETAQCMMKIYDLNHMCASRNECIKFIITFT